MNNNNDLMIKQSRGGGGGGPPCGACKFLRRKCVMGCVFAPYFDSDHGAAHFAAVHKVFGASNASKLLLRLPPHKRLDAVVTLCYEALARVRDPIYGCVAHIFTLQQQVVNLQAELAIVQSRLSTLQLQCVPSSMSSTGYLPSAYEPTSLLVVPSSPRCAMNLESDRLLVQPPHHGPVDTMDDVLDQMDDQEIDDAQLQAVARDFVARYLTGVKLGSLHSRKNI